VILVWCQRRLVDLARCGESDQVGLLRLLDGDEYPVAW
jgi:hypothetical protein